VAMGITIMALAFCSAMALSWGLRAGPLSFIPILAMIFTLAAPPPATAHALWVHSGWTAVGALAYFGWAVLCSRVLQPRYRTLALAAALSALAALLRSRAALLSRGEGGGASPLQDWIRSQVALDERLQAARDLLFPAIGEPHTGPAVAVLLQAVEMRDTLLAGELDIELLGNDGPANQLRERLRVHGGRVADAIEAMARGLRDHGMKVPASAATPLAETDIEMGEPVPHPSRAATAPDAAAAASIAQSAASAAATAPFAAVDAGVAAADAAQVGAAAAQAVAHASADDGPAADPATLARNAAAAARADARARAAVRPDRPALSAGGRVLRPRAPDGGGARAHAGRAARP